MILVKLKIEENDLGGGGKILNGDGGEKYRRVIVGRRGQNDVGWQWSRFKETEEREREREKTVTSSWLERRVYMDHLPFPGQLYEPSVTATRDCLRDDGRRQCHSVDGGVANTDAISSGSNS